MPAECTHILPDRRKCAQFALRGKPYCSPHMDPERRRRSDELRNLVESIKTLDLPELLDILIEITDAACTRSIPTSHANAAYTAALDRLFRIRALTSIPGNTSGRSE
jgi:hypothetical protein